MRKRTRGREVALQALYQLEIMDDDINELDLFFKEQDVQPDVLDFALSLVNGCKSQKKELDEKIVSVAEHWKLHRMAVVDRCILRMGAYELLFRNDIPPKVAINEAVDLAKKFSTENSGPFVNGILDKIYVRYVNKPA